MSKNNLLLFIRKVETDHQVKEKLKFIYLNNQGDTIDKIVQLGAEMGFDFTNEELRQFSSLRLTSQTKNELDD